MVRQVYLPLLAQQAGAGKSSKLSAAEAKVPAGEMAASLDRFSTHVNHMIHELQGAASALFNASYSFAFQLVNSRKACWQVGRVRDGRAAALSCLYGLPAAANFAAAAAAAANASAVKSSCTCHD